MQRIPICNNAKFIFAHFINKFSKLLHTYTLKWWIPWINSNTFACVGLYMCCIVYCCRTLCLWIHYLRMQKHASSLKIEKKSSWKMHKYKISSATFEHFKICVAFLMHLRKFSSISNTLNDVSYAHNIEYIFWLKPTRQPYYVIFECGAKYTV